MEKENLQKLRAGARATFGDLQDLIKRLSLSVRIEQTSCARESTYSRRINRARRHRQIYKTLARAQQRGHEISINNKKKKEKTRAQKKEDCAVYTSKNKNAVETKGHSP